MSAFPYFSIEGLVLCLSTFKGSLYISASIPILVINIENIFYQVCQLFTDFVVFVAMQSFYVVILISLSNTLDLYL
jgi:hypothetical protein